MKRRDKRSFEDAITRIMGALSPEVAGETVGKSASLIRRWSDPDDHPMPRLEEALKLDIAYLEAGHGSAPIFEIYSLRLQTRDLSPKAACVVVAMLGLQTACGQLAEAVAAAKSPTGPGGARITQMELRKVMEGVDIVRRELDGIEKAAKGEAVGLREVG